MVSKGNSSLGWRTLLGAAAIASVVSFAAINPAKAHDDDEDGSYYHGWNFGDWEDREEAEERHQWAEEHPYEYGYYARPRAYYYTGPRVYYPPPAYYAPQSYSWGGFDIDIPIN